MKSEDFFPMPAGALLVLTLELPDFEGIDPRSKKPRMMPCILSWNQVLQLQPFARQKLKGQIQRVFLSALLASASSCSTMTTSAKSTSSIAADTLASYRETLRVKRVSRQNSAKRAKANVHIQKSAST
jgi:hypothetical protein